MPDSVCRWILAFWQARQDLVQFLEFLEMLYQTNFSFMSFAVESRDGCARPWTKLKACLLYSTGIKGHGQQVLMLQRGWCPVPRVLSLSRLKMSSYMFGVPHIFVGSVTIF